MEWFLFLSWVYDGVEVKKKKGRGKWVGFRSHLLLRGWCGFEGGGVASSLLSKGCDCVCVSGVSVWRKDTWPEGLHMTVMVLTRMPSGWQCMAGSCSTKKKENTMDTLSFFPSSLKSSHFPHGMTPGSLALAFTAFAVVYLPGPRTGPHHTPLFVLEWFYFSFCSRVTHL